MAIDHIGLVNTDRILETLPNELIEKIFEFLPPNDLAQISLTSHKFQDAVMNHFRLKRQLKCGSITIDSKSDPRFCFDNKSDIYKIRFRSLIPHVKVNIRDKNGLAETIKFINDNCCKKLKTLEIINWTNDTIIINVYKYSAIAEQLKNVEFLVLNKDIRMNLESDLFSNLRALCIHNMIYEDQDIFFNQKFPKLETLSLREMRCKENDLTKLLRNNSQLKNIFCDSADTIRWALTTNIKLSNVVLTFKAEPIVNWTGHEEPIVKLDEFYADMFLCAKRKVVDSLELAHGDNLIESDIRELGRIKNLKRIHFVQTRLTFLDNIILMPSVEQLCLPDVYLTPPKLKIFVICFPNMTKLSMGINYSASTVKGKDVVSFIVGAFPKLTYLYCYGIQRRNIEENIDEWNRIRSALANASFLNIHFGSTGSYPSVHRKSLSIHFETNVSCPVCKPKLKLERLCYMDTLSKSLH